MCLFPEEHQPPLGEVSLFTKEKWQFLLDVKTLILKKKINGKKSPRSASLTVTFLSEEEVPKISLQDATPQRSVLRQPQLAEQ